MIINQAEGSVRDALNLLEQVRFLGKVVSKEIVLQILGYVDDSQLLSILTAILDRQPQQILHILKTMQQGVHSAEFIWYRLIELLRLLLWIKYGVEPAQTTDSLKLLAEKNSLQKLHHILEVLYNYESIFTKTTAQQALLETVLLQLCQRYKKNNNNNSSSSLPQQQIVASQDETLQEKTEIDSFDEQEDNDEEDEEYVEQWAIFIQEVEKLDDSLVISIFKQGQLLQFDKDTGWLTVGFYKELMFFKDWVEESCSSWLPLLQKIFAKNARLKPVFTGTKKIETRLAAQKNQTNNIHKKSVKKYSAKSKNVSIVKQLKEPTIDISDKDKWKKTHLILRYFPSRVTEIRK